MQDIEIANLGRHPDLYRVRPQSPKGWKEVRAFKHYLQSLPRANEYGEVQWIIEWRWTYISEEIARDWARKGFGCTFDLGHMH